MSHKSPLGIAVVVAMLMNWNAVSVEAGTINLEWRPMSQTVIVGSTVDVGLFAVSDDAVDDDISVMDVILEWDPVYLSLLGVNDNGPYNWLSSGFPPSAIGDLNLDFADGDATYTARSQFSPPPGVATPAGLLVTTVQFMAVAETAATAISIPESKGLADTIVVGDVPGLDVHGSLGSASVTIIPEPASLLLLLLGMGIRRRPCGHVAA